MKKILLIGELTTVLAQVSEILAESFQVQMTPDEPELCGTLRHILNPDLIVWYAAGEAGRKETVTYIKELLAMKVPPVLGIETPDTVAVMESIEEEYPYFSHVERPVTGDELVEICRGLIGIRGGSGEEKTGEIAPSAAPGREAEAEERPAEYEPVKQFFSRRKRILVVDDSPLEVRRLVRILEERYDVLTAGGGMAGLKTVQKEKPDLVLLDYFMPGMDGKAVYEVMRCDPECKDIPVIFLSAAKEKAQIMSILGLSPNGYVIKPAEPEQLLLRIREALKGKES